MAIISCPECSGKISDTVKQCVHCGSEISVCPECKTVFAGSAEVCSNCGYTFKQQEQATKKDKVSEECRTAKEVVERWEKSSSIQKWFYNNYVMVALFAIVAVLIIVAAVQLIGWNDLEKTAEIFTKIKTTLFFAALFFVAAFFYSSIGNYYRIISMSRWFGQNKIDVAGALRGTFGMDFDTMVFDDACAEIGGAQWCLLSASYSHNVLYQSKMKNANIAKVILVAIAAVLFYLFLSYNIEVYMEKEILESDALGIEGFVFADIGRWWALIAGVVAMAARSIISRWIDKEEENSVVAYIDKHMPDKKGVYAKYVEADAFVKFMEKRTEEASV